MSRQGPPRRSTPSIARSALNRLRSTPTLQSIPESSVLPPAARRAPLLRSLTGSSTSSNSSRANGNGNQHVQQSKPNQRTSKASQKLVVLPSEPQTAKLDGVQKEEISSADYRSDGERMPKAERQRASYRRITAYSTAEGFRLKLLAAFLKREHGVAPRVYDEAVYAVCQPFTYRGAILMH